MSTMIASTRRTWIQLPRVYPLTMPSSQRTNRMMVIVQSIVFSPEIRPGPFTALDRDPVERPTMW